MKCSKPTQLATLTLACLAPASARAETIQIVPGVNYIKTDLGIDVHVVVIERDLEGYELRVLGAQAGPGKMYTRTVQELAEDADAIVAINGYFFSGPDGTERDQVVTPDSTLIIDDKQIFDCYNPALVGCLDYDRQIIGFAGGMDIGMFTSAEFRQSDSDAFHRFAVGSDYPIMVDGVCIPGMPYDFSGRTAIGFNEDAVIFLTTEPVYNLWNDPSVIGFDREALCTVMTAAKAENAVMLDGGSAVGMVVNGVHLNPLAGYLGLKYGPQRHVANAIGLVKVDPVTPGLCPSGDGLYCGGPVGLEADTLYMCTDGKFTASEQCEHGCVVAVPGQNDVCAAELGTCPNGDGLYCGGSVGLGLDTLYYCEDGSYEVSMVCPDECVNAGDGNNDYCSDVPCKCDSGECCDGCFFWSASHVCGTEFLYDCIGGGCGADIGVQSRDRRCSGASAGCDGELGGWSSQSIHADCTSSQTCSSGASTCQDDAMCVPCEYTYEITDYQCSTFTSANGQGPGGGEIIEICGTVGATGGVTVKARKYDGTTFGSRPYQVRVSPPGDGPCGPDTYIYKISDDQPQGIDTDELVFQFDSIWEDGQWEKGYCVTASTKPGDQGYDGSSQEQKSWYYSDKFRLERSCN